MMFSIKPLEWSGRSSNGKIHKAYVVPMEYWAWENAGFGYWSWGSLAGREVYGGLDGAKAAAQADYESRIFSALSTPPAAAESSASVEARLREALIILDERLRACGSLYTAEDAYDSLCREFVSEALSAVGDEARKSEGGTEARRAKTGNMLGSVPGEEVSSSATGIERATVQEAATQPCAGVAPGPSDPTADRREIVARELRRFHQKSCYPDALDCEVAIGVAKILAALDGGAGG